MLTRELRHYKGFMIEANPQPSGGGTTRNWTTYLVIRRDRPAGAKFRPFEDDVVHPSRIAAVRHCFELGQRIIDGEVPHLSVADL